ncbi:MAG: hypothetical protein JXA11_15490 [Phycisphaerae bacterium]|nr:hypothetical protein [Phycisphaerae bacterium]
MTQPVVLQLDAPIHQVDVVGDESSESRSMSAPERQLAQMQAQLERRAEAMEQQFAARQAELESTVRALRTAGKQLDSLREELIRDLHTEAVDLALRIARKVLHQEIESQGYRIDPIIEEAMSHLPKRGEITVRLNPADFERSALAQQDTSGEEHIHFTADPSVPPAGCVVDSAEGVVESDPDAAMEHIEQTLTRNE